MLQPVIYFVLSLSGLDCPVRLGREKLMRKEPQLISRINKMSTLFVMRALKQEARIERIPTEQIRTRCKKQGSNHRTEKSLTITIYTSLTCASQVGEEDLIIGN